MKCITKSLPPPQVFYIYWGKFVVDDKNYKKVLVVFIHNAKIINQSLFY